MTQGRGIRRSRIRFESLLQQPITFNNLEAGGACADNNDDEANHMQVSAWGAGENALDNQGMVNPPENAENLGDAGDAGQQGNHAGPIHFDGALLGIVEGLECCDGIPDELVGFNCVECCASRRVAQVDCRTIRECTRPFKGACGCDFPCEVFIWRASALHNCYAGYTTPCIEVTCSAPYLSCRPGNMQWKISATPDSSQSYGQALIRRKRNL